MTDESSHDATALSFQAHSGDTAAHDRLLKLVYDELRALAHYYLKQEAPDISLDPTALVHEAYLKLIDQDRVEWQGRSHFFAVGAQAMRRILIDHGRGKSRLKRGGGMHRLSISDDLGLSASTVDDYLVLSEALDRLRALDERQAQIVELRFFGGMKMDEIADYLGISKRSVESDWTVAKAWLRRELLEGHEP